MTWADRSAPQGDIFKWDGDGNPWGPPSPGAVCEIFRTWFDTRLNILHNAPYDLAVAAAAHPALLPHIFDAIEAGRVSDTLIRQKLWDIAFGQFRGKFLPDGSFEKITYHLKDVVRRHCGYQMSKGEDTWRMHYAELYHVPLRFWPGDARAYAISDAVLTLRAWHSQERQRQELIAQGRPDLFANEIAQVYASFGLQLASCWGLRVHPDKIGELKDCTVREFDILRDMLLEEGLVRTEKKKGVLHYVRNTKAAKERMIEAFTEYREDGTSYVRDDIKKTAPSKTAPEGNICLDEEACEDSGDEMLQAYARAAALSNVLVKDIKKMESGEIHTSFDSLIASGRIASRGFNIQNLRRKGGTRECFYPREGYVYCLIDLDTAELRAVAQVCIKMFGYSRLGQVINEGKDAHCYLAAQALGRTYEEIKALHDVEDPWIGEERQDYKSANFGLWGGMRWRRFQKLLISGQKARLSETREKLKKESDHGKRLELEAAMQAIRDRVAALTPERVQFIRETWLKTWPESNKYLDTFERLCAGGQRTTTLQLFSGRIRGGMMYSEAANTMFQGLIADAIKAALCAVTREMYDPTKRSVLYGSRLVNVPHDELISEVPRSIAHECSQRIEQITLAEVGKFLPDVPPAATAYLSEWWSKSAHKVVDPVTGETIPWAGQKKAKKPVVVPALGSPRQSAAAMFAPVAPAFASALK